MPYDLYLTYVDAAVTCNGVMFVCDCCIPSVVTCPPLNATNGNTSDTSRGYLDDVHLLCHHGYRVVGNQSLSNVSAHCTAAGNWSVADLDCERKLLLNCFSCKNNL